MIMSVYNTGSHEYNTLVYTTGSHEYNTLFKNTESWASCMQLSPTAHNFHNLSSDAKAPAV